MYRIIEGPRPTVGLVIGTFAAVPYVHLALESRKRNYPGAPVLVHDDDSPRRDELRRLCAAYGAEFVRSGGRGRWTVGDMSAYVAGLDWAGEARLELLVKMSRRFIPLHDWVPGLQALACETQYATYSNRCRHFGFGFRTECVGFHVRSWRGSGALESLRKVAARNESTFVEGYVHDRAREVHATGCGANREYERSHPRPGDADAYGVWGIMAEERTTRLPDVLWHDADQPVDYCRVARLYGLDYRLADFLDPNQGYGLGDP